MVVATGNYYGNFVRETEVIDLDNPSVSCKPWMNADEKIFATGGLFENGLLKGPFWIFVNDHQYAYVNFQNGKQGKIQNCP